MAFLPLGRGFADFSLTCVGDEAPSPHSDSTRAPTEIIGRRPEATAPRRASAPGGYSLEQSKLRVQPTTSVTSETPKPPEQALFATLVRNGSARAVTERLADLHARGGQRLLLTHVMNTECSLHDERVVQSALHVAARRGNLEILEILLATQADPNVINDQMSTPLHLCAECGHHELAEALLRAGAMPDARNSFGRSPKELAQGNRWDTSEVALGKAKIQNLLGNMKCWDTISEASTAAPRSSAPTLSETDSTVYGSERP